MNTSSGKSELWTIVNFMIPKEFISKDQIKADPSCVSAIKESKKWSCKHVIKKLLHMVNILSKFLHNLSNAIASMREFLKNTVDFQ